MPDPSTERRALVVTNDLFFRAKLGAVLEQAGWAVSWCGTAPLAVVELGSPQAMSRIERLVASGARVIAFGSHVRADLLRSAREAGAVAVPNSEVERVLRAELADA
jgi:hypothetical protein